MEQVVGVRQSSEKQGAYFIQLYFFVAVASIPKVLCHTSAKHTSIWFICSLERDSREVDFAAGLFSGASNNNFILFFPVNLGHRVNLF